ncbi:hypothetical protein SMKI_03G0720 [Saccharomyces mikatae IFO 1815]|uniref:WKF domain-containing protein n=1 Tax=Saccharomyces mikatae IFO 1815 TaxID=226126 RepID=A0AA35IY45_SACMI|nr:uncharacterized protein SMKI_03G0720 [Saccharomyces mikatae IFO 1815]CAI4037597.1 hypothetical protein SMKI_03G0720 [Saccharomyces mikatae IFO 1815]
MPENHIPAWKRIALKNQTSKSEDNISKQTQSNIIDDDPLNITTHLSTGNLTKKEKKRIINGEKKSTKKEKRVSKPGTKKKEKLSKEEKDSKKNRILKDQLRYLIDFFKTKSESKFPAPILELESVKENYGNSLTKDESVDSGVVEVWKFSKQKQNWLIKHFFNLDEIPSIYNDLLLLYFKDLQGKSKDELISKCQDKLKQWNDYAEDQEAKIKALIEGENASEPVNYEETEKGKNESGAVEKVPKELLMPNKELVQRSLKLLEIWNNEDSRPILELKNFSVDV